MTATANSRPRLTALDEVRDLLGGDNFPKCESRSLRLEKFVSIGGNTKKAVIDAVVVCPSESARPMPLPAGAVQFPSRLKSRLIVNQAGGILENAGLCLHPHFGYPYIPGSAVKGVARHAAWCEWHDEADPEKKDDIARRIARVFGSPTEDRGLDEYLKKLEGGEKRFGGCVSFFAAEPEDGKASLVTDIVNCHHPKYYARLQPDATDDEAPNPQFFLAVESGATFVFTIAPIRCANVGASSTEKACLDDAKNWLKKAVSENGIGAKTSAGYGWFAVGAEADENNWREKRERQKCVEIEKRQKKAEQEKLHLQVMSLADMDEKSSEFVALLRTLEKHVDDMTEQDKAELNRQKKREPQLSPEENVRREWEGKPDTQCAMGRLIRYFPKLDEAMKAAVVFVLRTHPLWQYLRTGNFTDIKKKHLSDVRKGVEAIRVFAKTTPEGKMK